MTNSNIVFSRQPDNSLLHITSDNHRIKVKQYPDGGYNWHSFEPTFKPWQTTFYVPYKDHDWSGKLIEEKRFETYLTETDALDAYVSLVNRLQDTELTWELDTTS